MSDDLTALTEALSLLLCGSVARCGNWRGHREEAERLAPLVAPLIADRERAAEAKGWNEGARFANDEAWVRENCGSAVSGEPNE